MNNLRKLDPTGLCGCYIAGGAVLSRVTKTEIADWDIYPKTKEAALDICLTLLEDNCFVLNITDRAITFKSNNLVADNGERQILQVMTFGVFPTTQSIFNFFDFSVCMGAYDCDSEEYTFSDDFWPDVASKTLRFNPSTKYPLASLIRLGKYRKKGYEIGKGETAKIALAVADKGVPTSWEELESQLGGVYGKSIKILAGEDKEFTLEKAYEILSDLEYNLEYFDEDVFDWVKEDELEVIFSEEPLVVYTGDSGDWIVEGSALEPFSVDERIFELPNTNFVEKPLSECPVKFIKAYKQVREDDKGDLIGAVYTGNHNGVIYRPFEKTSYDKEPYLFSYVKPQTLPFGKIKFFQHEVMIPAEDLVKEQYGKYISKSMILGKEVK